MDPGQLIGLLASQPPEKRLALAAQFGIDGQTLLQMEAVAAQNGIALVGGSAFVDAGAAAPGGGARAPAPDASAIVSISVANVRRGARARARATALLSTRAF